MKNTFTLLLMILLISSVSVQSQIMLGQVDDFNSGTAMNWENGSNASNMMLVSADGSGAGGKLVAYNSDQWSGNYISANVHSISFKISNLSNETLHIRLAMGNASDPNSGTWFCSTDAIILSPNATDVMFEFPLDEMYLTRVEGSGTHSQLFANISTLRILHNPSPSAKGVNIVTSVHIDDITANQVYLDIDEVSNLSLSIYPNPVHDQLTVNSGNMNKSIAVLYDITGKSISSWEQTGIMNIDFSEFTTGVYILQLTENDKTITKRIIKD